jgi:hypothetical protein
MVDATPITDELVQVITAIFAVGGAVLIVYQLRHSFGYIRDALGSLRDGMTDDQHYENAYQNYKGDSFEDFEANYSRLNKY